MVSNHLNSESSFLRIFDKKILVPGVIKFLSKTSSWTSTLPASLHANIRLKILCQNPTFGMMQWHFEVIWGWFVVSMRPIEDGCGRSWIILKNIFFNKRRCFRQTMNWDKIKNFFRKRTQHCFNWDINRITSFWQIQDNRTSFSMLRIMYKPIN